MLKWFFGFAFISFSFFSSVEAVEIERTLSIIKPDAVSNNCIGEIVSRFEKNQLSIAAIKMVKLTPAEAQKFYEVHRNKPFFEGLITYISSGPIVALVLEGENAVAKNRELMGSTDPKKASKGTIRADFARSIEQNAVHGSDSLENAQKEIFFFFKPEEIFKRN